ncbi:MAG: hypothetical protein QXF56_02325 [Candidatus Micrarchaeia archaeon]
MRKAVLCAFLLILSNVAYADMGPNPPYSILERYGKNPYFITIAVALTTIIELITSLVYLHLRKLSKKILVTVIIANIISVPLFYVYLTDAIKFDDEHWQPKPPLVMTLDTYPYDITHAWIILIVGEIMVFVLEAFLLFRLNRNRNMTLVRGAEMSLINNFASFLIGLVFSDYIFGFINPFKFLF